jgi:hypothetical protein
MPWARLDDDFYDHEKTKAAGNEAAGVYARMLSYSARHLTDGRVPYEIFRDFCEGDCARVTSAKTPGIPKPSRFLSVFSRKTVAKRVLAQLVGCDLVRVGQGRFEGTLVIKNYLVRNPSAKEVKARRAAETERKRQQRQAKVPPGQDKPSRRDTRKRPAGTPAGTDPLVPPPPALPIPEDLTSKASDSSPTDQEHVLQSRTPPALNGSNHDPDAEMRVRILLSREGKSDKAIDELIEAVGVRELLAKLEAEAS